MTDTNPLDQPIFVLFSGAAPHLTFVEVADQQGRGVNVGEWVELERRGVTYRALKFTSRSLLRAHGTEVQPADPLRTHHQALEDIR